MGVIGISDDQGLPVGRLGGLGEHSCHGAAGVSPFRHRDHPPVPHPAVQQIGSAHPRLGEPVTGTAAADGDHGGVAKLPSPGERMIQAGGQLMGRSAVILRGPQHQQLLRRRWDLAGGGSGEDSAHVD